MIKGQGEALGMTEMGILTGRLQQQIQTSQLIKLNTSKECAFYDSSKLIKKNILKSVYFLIPSTTFIIRLTPVTLLHNIYGRLVQASFRIPKSEFSQLSYINSIVFAYNQAHSPLHLVYLQSINQCKCYLDRHTLLFKI